MFLSSSLCNVLVRHCMHRMARTCRRLALLSVRNNSFSGLALAAWKHLHNLQRIDISENRINANIQAFFDHLPRTLKDIFFNDKQFSGRIDCLSSPYVFRRDRQGTVEQFRGMQVPHYTAPRVGSHRCHGPSTVKIPSFQGLNITMQVQGIGSVVRFRIVSPPRYE